MKKILLAVLLCVSSIMMAQNEKITATLQTGDDVQIFYGYEAFEQAYWAAEDGSVITLSEGTFKGVVKIQKNISIYGKGFEDNEEAGIPHHTVLYYSNKGSGVFFEPTNDTPLQNLILEGIEFTFDFSMSNITNVVISKCSMGNVGISNIAQSVSFRQCYIRGGVGINEWTSPSVDLQNCYITGNVSNRSKLEMLLFNHCLLKSSIRQHNYAIYTNCVLGGTGIISDATFHHCIFEGSEEIPNIHHDNWYNVDLSTIFADGTYPDYAPEKTFMLAHPEAYPTTDGTQVGLYGGSYPWNKIPSIPVVNALQLQVDGNQLNVTYEVQTR